MEVYLIRHGKTKANERRAYCGRSDEPLSQLGQDEAKAIRYAIQPTQVYVSPLLRARQTAAILFPQAEQLLVEDFREMDFGAFEGRSAAEMANDPAYQQWLADQCLSPCPEGEGMQDFCQRVQLAFRELVGLTKAKQEKRLAIVAHGGTIMAIMSRYGRPAQEYFHWFAPNCGGYKALLSDEAEPESLVLCEWEALIPTKPEQGN